MKVMNRAMAVSDREAVGGGDGVGDVGLGGAHGLGQFHAVGEPRSNCRGQRAAGAVSVAGVDTRGGKPRDRMRLNQKVDALGPAAMPAFDQDGTRAQFKQPLGLLLHAMDGMQRKLRGLVGHIRESAESIGTASKEVADGNQDLSVRTEQTAGNLQHAASAMTQLTGNVRQSADAAVQANSLAVSASDVARRGGQAVSNVVATMDEINASSKKISAKPVWPLSWRIGRTVMPGVFSRTSTKVSPW